MTIFLWNFMSFCVPLYEILRNNFGYFLSTFSSFNFIGSNILLARMATRKAKPDGQYHLQPDEVDDFIRGQLVTNLPGKYKSLLSICLWEITDISKYFSCHPFSYCGAVCFHRQRTLIMSFPQAIWIFHPQDPSAGMTCMSFLSLFNKLLRVMKKKTKHYIEHPINWFITYFILGIFLYSW